MLSPYKVALAAALLGWSSPNVDRLRPWVLTEDGSTFGPLSVVKTYEDAESEIKYACAGLPGCKGLAANADDVVVALQCVGGPFKRSYFGVSALDTRDAEKVARRQAYGEGFFAWNCRVLSRMDD